MTQLTTEDIDAVCDLVDELCGICWDESKAYLIEARLAALTREHECENYAHLVQKVRAGIVPSLKEDVIDAVTTNETLWFRDSSPFDALQFKLIPELIDDKADSAFPKRLRIWSAACSTGQEPYSIAITIAETIPNVATWDIQVLGTDISPAAVEQASRGVYSKLEINRGMDAGKLQKYFDNQGDAWKIKDEIRSMCAFQQLNLLSPFTQVGPFDIIFCRNVAIYFTHDDRSDLFRRLAQALTPNGWILAGSSESLADLGPQWQPQQHCRANVYGPNRTMAVCES